MDFDLQGSHPALVHWWMISWHEMIFYPSTDNQHLTDCNDSFAQCSNCCAASMHSSESRGPPATKTLFYVAISKSGGLAQAKAEAMFRGLMAPCIRIRHGGDRLLSLSHTLSDLHIHIATPCHNQSWGFHMLIWYTVVKKTLKMAWDISTGIRIPPMLLLWARTTLTIPPLQVHGLDISQIYSTFNIIPVNQNTQ